MDCYSLAKFILIDFMASTLATQKEACLFQYPDDLRCGDAREFLTHTATSNEVKLTDSA